MNLNILSSTAPSGTCPATINDWLKVIEQYCTVPFNDEYALFVIGATTPSVDDQDKVWIRLNSDGTLKGVYIYVNGAWSTNETFPVGLMCDFYGVAGDIEIPWAICNGQTVNGITTPNYTGLFTVGASGDVGAGGAYDVGSTGGSETHTLTSDEMPSHNHILPMHSATTDAPATYGEVSAPGNANLRTLEPASSYTTNVYLSSSTGGGGAHENRPPYKAAYKIMYVGYP